MLKMRRNHGVCASKRMRPSEVRGLPSDLAGVSSHDPANAGMGGYRGLGFGEITNDD
jgi:hypothetical protein